MPQSEPNPGYPLPFSFPRFHDGASDPCEAAGADSASDPAPGKSSQAGRSKRLCRIPHPRCAVAESPAEDWRHIRCRELRIPSVIPVPFPDLHGHLFQNSRFSPADIPQKNCHPLPPAGSRGWLF